MSNTLSLSKLAILLEMLFPELNLDSLTAEKLFQIHRYLFQPFSGLRPQSLLDEDEAIGYGYALEFIGLQELIQDHQFTKPEQVIKFFQKRQILSLSKDVPTFAQEKTLIFKDDNEPSVKWFKTLTPDEAAKVTGKGLSFCADEPSVRDVCSSSVDNVEKEIYM